MANYLRYAIGEILLVVVGILIALQINNWNEARKSHIYEQKILTDLLHTVDSDLGIQTMLIDRLDSMEFGVSNIYRLIGKNESSVDSIQKYLPYLMMGIRFGYDPGAYESLKSVGLDKISDNSIRVGLARLYDFLYPRIKLMIENEYGQQFNEANSLMDKFWVSEVIIDAEGKPTIMRRIKINDPFQNQDFLNSIRKYSKAYKNARYRIGYIISESKKMKKSLENYLGKIPLKTDK